MAYGTLGFFWLDRHYSTTFYLGEAAKQTLAIFTANNLGLQFNSRFGRFFVDSIYIIGGVTLLYTLWMLLRLIVHSEATIKEK